MWQTKEFDYKDRVVDFINKNKDKIINVSITYICIGMKFIIFYYTENINDIIE